MKPILKHKFFLSLSLCVRVWIPKNDYLNSENQDHNDGSDEDVNEQTYIKRKKEKLFFP